jgi:hypothetical protein
VEQLNLIIALIVDRIANTVGSHGTGNTFVSLVVLENKLKITNSKQYKWKQNVKGSTPFRGTFPCSSVGRASVINKSNLLSDYSVIDSTSSFQVESISLSLISRSNKILKGVKL